MAVRDVATQDRLRHIVERSFALMDRLSVDDLYALAAHTSPDAAWSGRVLQALLRAELSVRDRQR